jgi:hypothetical protein
MADDCEHFLDNRVEHVGGAIQLLEITPLD